MLQFKIKAILEMGGVLNPFSYLIKYLKFGNHKAHNLLNQTQKTFTLHDLSKLCQYLHCTPNDLFYWQPDKRIHLTMDHPCLTQLKEEPTNTDWQTLLAQVNKADAKVLHEKMQELINEMKKQKNNEK
jgi:Cro/C1-type HTH DNA-binding domain